MHSSASEPVAMTPVLYIGGSVGVSDMSVRLSLKKDMNSNENG